jgi:hypothetical protein
MQRKELFPKSIPLLLLLLSGNINPSDVNLCWRELISFLFLLELDKEDESLDLLEELSDSFLAMRNEIKMRIG